MGRRVVAAEALPSRRLDGDRHVLALAEAALGDAQPVDDQPALVLGVEDVPPPLPAREDAGVADLAARLRIARRAVEDGLDLVAGDRLPAPLALAHHGEDPRRRRERP